MYPEVSSSLFLLVIVLLVPSFRKSIFRRNVTKISSVRSARIDFFDFLKGVAIVGVIIVHVLFYFGNLYEGANHYWIDVANNLVRYSIGFFILVSGILLREDFLTKGSTIKFYTRKLTRIIIPYTVANIFIARIQGYSFNEFVTKLVTGNASIPYYFVIVLVQLYLLYPLLVRYRTKSWFLPGSLLISYLFYIIADPSPLLGFVFFGKYLFFFSYGIAMREKFLSSQFETSRTVWLALIGLFALSLFIFPGHYYNVRYFYVLALFHLLFLYRASIEKMKLFQSVAWFGNFSLWIFLTHMTVVSYTYSLTSKLPFNQLLVIMITVILSVPASILWAAVIRRIYDFFWTKVIEVTA